MKSASREYPYLRSEVYPYISRFEGYETLVVYIVGPDKNQRRPAIRSSRGRTSFRAEEESLRSVERFPCLATVSGLARTSRRCRAHLLAGTIPSLFMDKKRTRGDPSAFHICEQVCKPGSVLSSHYLGHRRQWVKHLGDGRASLAHDARPLSCARIEFQTNSFQRRESSPRFPPLAHFVGAYLCCTFPEVLSAALPYLALWPDFLCAAFRLAHALLGYSPKQYSGGARSCQLVVLSVLIEITGYYGIISAYRDTRRRKRRGTNTPQSSLFSV